MSAFSASNSSVSDYDLRSLQHERRMLAQYRQTAARDASLLQPLANACWRAACFEWQIYSNVETVRRLWGESARALVRGFAHHRSGFDPSPDQFILALHLALAARERDAFTALALVDSNLRVGTLREAHAFRGSRAHFHLAEGYALVARALIERTHASAHAAIESLTAARRESEREWWERQFPEALDAAWRMSEHEAICVLLTAIARCIVCFSTESAGADEFSMESIAEEFAVTIDETLQRLEKFIARDINHHPKLYLWLPGISLCALAASIGLPLNWLPERHSADAARYSRLPFEFLQ